MIEIQGLTKSYEQVMAVKPLNLKIGNGTIFGFVGPNGSGKTTTIRMLCGLLAPSGGSATVAGVDVIHDPESVRSAVGYMPDSLRPYEGMRVWEYLDFFGAAYRIPRQRRRQRIDEILQLVGIETMRDYFVDTLSHGMRQRVGVARTLVHDPNVLFLDEPTNGLDPRARVEMRLLLDRLRALGKTILISSHILPELASVCDQVGFMERGQLVASGPVAEVQRAVRQHRVFEIELRTDPEAAQAAVRQAVSADKFTGSSILGNLLRVELIGDDQQMVHLLADLIRGGHAVLGFREVVTDLEEAFLVLTEHSTYGARSETV